MILYLQYQFRENYLVLLVRQSLLIPILFCVSSLTVKAQDVQSIDKQITEVEKSARKDLSLAENKIQNLYKSVQEWKDDYLMSRVLYVYGRVSEYQGRFGKADSLQKESFSYLAELQAIPDQMLDSMRIYHYYGYGVLKSKMGDMPASDSLLKLSANLAFQYSNFSILAKTNLVQGVNQKIRSNYDSSAVFYQKAAEYARKLNDYRLEWDLNYSLVDISMKKDEYYSALDKAFYMLALTDSIADPLKKAKSAYLLSYIYNSLQNSENALKYGKIGLDIASGYDDRSLLLLLNNALADAYGEQDSSLFYLKQSLRIGLSENRTYDLLNIYTSLSRFYTQRDLVDSVYKYSREGLLVAEQFGQEFYTGIFSYFLAQSDYRSNDLYKSQEMAQRAWLLFQGHGDLDWRLKSGKLLLQLSEDLGEEDEVVYFAKQVVAIQEELFRVSKTKELAIAEAKFEFEQKEKLLKYENEIRELNLVRDLEERTFYQYLAFLGVAVLLVIAILMFLYIRKKRRDNQILHQKNTQITEQSEQLKELSTFKQGLTGMIAHDMKNHLNVVIGLSNGSADEQRLKEISQSGKLMLNLVTNMLDIQKFEEARITLRKTHLPFKVLLREALAQVELLLVSKEIKLEKDITGNLNVYADRGLMVRVLVNLFTNAIKHLPLGGLLKVSAEPLENTRVKVSVTDNGSGIAKEDLPHIFDRFWQANTDASVVPNSTGLGLTFCQFAVEAHEGTITAFSEVGSGTTFTFDLEKGAKPVHKDQMLEIEFDRPHIELSDYDKQTIKEFVEKIKDIPLYKISKIDSVLSEIDDNYGQEIINWKKRVINAIYSHDEEAFHALIRKGGEYVPTN